NNALVKHTYTVGYTNKFNSASTLRFSANGAIRKSSSINLFNVVNWGNDKLLNSSNRNVDGNNDDYITNLNLSWIKAFKKKGRFLTLGGFGNIYNYRSNSLLKDNINLYDLSSNISSTITIDQIKDGASHNYISGITTSYVEPFSAKFSLGVNYNLGLNNSQS